MDTQLRDTLTRLHEQLRNTPQIDAESQQMLRQILSDLDASAASGAAAHGNRLEGLAVDFEAEHPALAAGVRELVALLSRAGL
ncbi:MAG: DUF4404 family protein [Steroidobacteraceae bacterium]